MRLYLIGRAKLISKNETVEITFLGTRGEIKVRSRRHQRHNALLIEHEDARIIMDCGTDWLGRLEALAIVVSAASMDSAAGPITTMAMIAATSLRPMVGFGSAIKNEARCGSMELFELRSDVASSPKAEPSKRENAHETP